MSGEITKALNSMAAQAASAPALSAENRRLTRENKRLERELVKARREIDRLTSASGSKHSSQENA